MFRLIAFFCLYIGVLFSSDDILKERLHQNPSICTLNKKFVIQLVYNESTIEFSIYRTKTGSIIFSRYSNIPIDIEIKGERFSFGFSQNDVDSLILLRRILTLLSEKNLKSFLRNEYASAYKAE